MRRFIFLTLAAMVPAAFIAIGLVAYDYYDRERVRLVRDSLSTARALAAAVDAEFGVIKSALITLASSRHITEGDFKGLHAQALDVISELKRRNETSLITMILTDASGRQLVNTVLPYGSPLPSVGDPAGLARVIKDDEVVITDLLVGPVIKQLGIGVGVPVKRNGVALYRLVGGISTERLSALLKHQDLPQNWLATVVDTSGTIVARTHDEMRLVGQKASPELVGRIKQVQEDSFDSQTLEGIPVLTIFSRAPISGYTVVMGVPQEQLRRNLFNSLARLFLVAFIALASALALATMLGRRFSNQA